MLPKKSLGQNFLTSIPARLAIVEGGKVTKDDIVLEIGPGKGFLTRALLDTGASVVALEKDRDLIPVLSEIFNNELQAGQLTLIEGDVLAFDPSNYKLQANSYKLIANIPYYITGAILSHFLSSHHKPTTMVVLIQKEVAERIVAREKKESLLSLSVKVYGTPRIAYRVSRGSFHPIPTVDSAVLAIENIGASPFENQYHEDMFFKVIHAGFSHKRKFALSNIKNIFKEHDVLTYFKEQNLSEKVRAEDVALKDWVTLSEKFL
jgi:16S rRNA (adenine1518-N6/adenine1519-N6)-dimethyltransferase